MDLESSSLEMTCRTTLIICVIKNNDISTSGFTGHGGFNFHSKSVLSTRAKKVDISHR